MSTFADLGLDHRLLRSLKKQGLTGPTAVQATTVPTALAGKDVVARGRTGSGKTLAYLLPMLNILLSLEDELERFQAVVLVPTSELVEQVRLRTRWPVWLKSMYSRINGTVNFP
jgi:ATP-dependent RNA helicase DDX56/DBP9